MKRLLPLVIGIFLISLIQAQVPALPEILQQKFEEEQLDLTLTYDETETVKSHEDYYYYISRDSGMDTLLGYRWDTITMDWNLEARIIKTYGADELVTEKLFQVWAGDTIWVDGLYFTYAYNADGNLTEMIIQHWVADSGFWKNHFKKTQTFDADGLLTDINTYWWKCWSEDWMNHHHKVFTYDNGTLVADTVNVWHLFNEEWRSFLYNAFTYNDDGLKILKTNYKKFMFAEDWSNNFRWNYVWDGAGEHITQVVGEDWHPMSETWRLWNRYNYTWNAEDLVTWYLYERYSPFDSTWDGKLQIDYFYDTDGNLIQYVMQKKPFCLDDWTNAKQAFFTYDADGNMIEKIVQRWDFDLEDWVNFVKWEMVLDYKNSMVGIGDNPGPDGIRAIFRNPYQMGDQVSYTGLDAGNYTVILLDITGRMVESHTYTPGQTIILNTPHNGAHLMMLSANNRIIHQTKIIISR